MSKKKKNNNFSQSNESLSEQQVKEVLDFAASYYNTALNGVVSKVATPDIVNSALQQITTNPIKPKEDEVNEVLADPKNNQNKIIGLMEYFELTDMLTKRTIYYLSDLPAFNFTFFCNNIKDKKDYLSDEYKSDYNKVREFFNKFNLKQQFKLIMKDMMRNETGYYIFRNDIKKYVFQQLPPQYCKITGKWDYGLLYDFNCEWFLRPGVDINEYPDSMKKIYTNVINSKNNLYNPSDPIGRRDSTFSYWSQTDPTKGYWAFKFNLNSYTNVPYLAATFPDAVLRPLIRKLQTNQNILAAQKVMVGLIPLLKNPKSGEVRDQFAISPKQMGIYLGLLKQGLNDAIKVGGVPFEDVKVLDFPTSDKNMYDMYNNTASAMSGVTQRVVYASDRMSAAEMEASKDVDSMIVTSVYPMFEDFLYYEVNKLTKKYKFTFKLEGTNYSTDKKNRLEQWKNNAALGIVLPQKLAAAMDMTPFELEAQMSEASSGDFTKNLVGLLNLNTAITQSGSGGRPKVDDSEMADSTGRKIDG